MVSAPAVLKNSRNRRKGYDKVANSEVENTATASAEIKSRRKQLWFWAIVLVILPLMVILVVLLTKLAQALSEPRQNVDMIPPNPPTNARTIEVESPSSMYSKSQVESQIKPQKLSVQECWNNYLDGLAQVQSAKGDFKEYMRMLRRRNITRPQKSMEEMVWAIGPGTTGTHGLAAMIARLGLHTLHYFLGTRAPDQTAWQRGLLNKNNEIIGNGIESPNMCHNHIENRNFVFPQHEDSQVDAITDTPVPEYVLDLLETYPNGKFIYTTRDPDEWAYKRLTEHPDSMALVIRPCGWKTSDFDLEGNAQLHQLHEKFVDCAVPEEQLLKVCIKCGLTYGPVADFLDVNLEDAGLLRDANLSRLLRHIEDSEFAYDQAFSAATISRIIEDNTDVRQKDRGVLYLEVSRTETSFWHFIMEEFLYVCWLLSHYPDDIRVVMFRPKDKRNDWNYVYDSMPQTFEFLRKRGDTSFQMIPSGEVWHDPSMWIPEVVRVINESRSYIVQTARKILPDEISKDEENTCDIIFQHREPDSTRSILNMEECFHETEKFIEAKSCYWKAHNSFWEDVILYSEASAVVLAHGGGLANTLWMESGSRGIIEFLFEGFTVNGELERARPPRYGKSMNDHLGYDKEQYEKIFITFFEEDAQLLEDVSYNYHANADCRMVTAALHNLFFFPLK